MECPNCNAQNIDSYKFCQKCGAKLPVLATSPQVAASPVAYVPPKNPLAQAAQIGIVGGGVSGFLIVLGWFTPWLGLGGLGGGLLRSSLLSPYLGILGSLSGIGNGLQITLAAFAAFIAGLGFEAPSVALVAFLILGFFLSIILVGAATIRGTVALYEARPANETDNSNKLDSIKITLQSLRNRSSYVLGSMVIIFIFASAVPFGTAVLGTGFYLTILGALSGYFSALFAQKRINA